MAPVLRRMLQTNIKKHLAISGVLCALSVVVIKVLVNDPRKAKYAEFYKTYDADKDFARMVQAGVFQSVKP